MRHTTTNDKVQVATGTVNPLPVDITGGTLDAVTSITNPIKLGFGDLTVDAWGTPKVSNGRSLYHGMFTFDIPEQMWFMYENSVEVATSTDIVSTNGAGVLTTTVTNTTLDLVSREAPRYQPNRGHLFSTALWCPLKTQDGQRTWGIGTPENCVQFRLEADGLLYAIIRSGNVETTRQLIDTSTVTGFDVEKGNVYDIQFQWRGVGDYKFFINLIHVATVSYIGTLTALSMENPALPIQFGAVRTTQDVALHVGCADITSEGGRADNEQFSSAYAENVTISGTDVPVMVIHNPLLQGGVTNTRSVTVARLSFNCAKRGSFKVWTTRNLADITGATFKPVGNGSFLTSDSVSMDVTAVKATAVTTANLRFMTFIPVQANVNEIRENPDPDRITLALVRGDYMIITGTASATSGDVVAEFGEQI